MTFILGLCIQRTLLHNIKLNVKQLFKKLFLYLHKLFKVLSELDLQPMNILDGKHQHLGVLSAHNRELSFHLILANEPIVSLHVIVHQDWPDDVNYPKLVPFGDIHELSVVVLWKHHSSCAFLEKVDVWNIISLKKDVLVVRDNLRLEKRADPSDEWAWLTF